MKFENTAVWGFEHALRGMRNPMNSWDKSDSKWVLPRGGVPLSPIYNIGENDLKLAQKLIKAGSEHRKFMRQIFVSVDITAPLYWWKEFDTYKVGTVANSTSTMHKIADKEFELDDFSCDQLLSYADNYKRKITCESPIEVLGRIIATLNIYRKLFIDTKDKTYWYQMIQLLPSSYNQKRTVTMTYENLLAMCSKGQRRYHKLNEWSGIDNLELRNFISWARELPYAKEMLFLDENKEQERIRNMIKELEKMNAE